MPGNLSGPTLLVILFIVLLLFGAPKLPALARSLGQSMKILKKEVSTDTADKNAQQGEEAPATTQTETATPADAELERARAEAAAARAEAEALRNAAQHQAVTAPETPTSPPESDRPQGA